MLDCIQSNDVYMLKLVVGGRSLNKRDLDLGIILAAKLGFTECVQCLLDAGADQNYINRASFTPLMTATQHNKIQTVQLLLEHKCDPNLISGFHLTPLHIAVLHGYSDIVDILIEHGASVHSRDFEGNTPLILSSRKGYYAIMKALLNAGCDVNAANYDGCTSLHFACHKARGYQILLDAGADPNVRDKDNVTPLIMAASEGFDVVVKALVKAKCDVNIQNESVKRTALHLLAFKGHTEAVSSLIYGGADIDVCDIDNRTPLWYAIQNKKVDVVRLLLKGYSHVDTFQCPAGASEEDCPAKLAFTTQQLSVIKMFIITGYDHRHVREYLQSNEFSDWLKSEEEFSHWLDFGCNAQTLKQLCRKWIRHHLGKQFNHHLQCLPIPEALRNYIFLEELHDH